ncbi:hypothetical protein K227x_20960 [Rubripirellula lacrimiformis]|uniref:Uncharacterized protein n=1 Tax=Rubripirellula lacrimiformis TaxID=1930273 RepID=A0A517N9A5_9BACT|nr:hypothetical protein [Rubripirellula lacrimiformis]QDT03711.1 hypothetical protein K227x_20960 [Rubripirellula lacrimiformis]
MRRLVTFLLLAFVVMLGVESSHVSGQGMGLPGGTTAAVPRTPDTPPSMQGQTPNPNNNNAFAGRAAAAPATSAMAPPSSGGKLPRTAGQVHRVYDLRPYTGYLTKHDHPEQAIIDWVLRETGTDVWFTEPFGFLNADRDSVSVYHTDEMHEVVNGVVDRFVAGEKEPQVMHLRVMTVGNANWRSRAHMLMQHVSVDSPGVQAWLLSKENAALVLNLLRQRTDSRQVHDLNIVTYNGQTETLASTRGRNYVRNVRPAPQAWPPYEPETGEVQEGYRLSISPLLSTDGRAIDCMIKAEIDQVDKLNPVDLELPLPNNQVHRARIDVPQVVSWRLHERFRWPSDMVLLLSCGVVASPERAQSAIPMLNMSAFTGATAGRADALMFIEFRGRASENLTTGLTPSSSVPQVATQPGGANRGRY